MKLRAEIAADRDAVRIVNERAFGRPEEAALVENLHAEGAVLLSLVAELDSRAVGHVLFSRAWVDDAAVVALAPVAVLPEYQRRGIADRLIRRGLEQVRESGERVVIVLGEPAYYQRFGFSSAKASAIESPFPREAFMARELESGALDGISGPIRYAKAFGL